ncbi:hypothetical protein LCGC14_1651900 [marine sediment metagenome]|uniref:NnrU domain-containing protein n=1 Tax=marine sediment metagenome TaxID=412755 RepID=A0A0F9HWK1_9ZZZZ
MTLLLIGIFLWVAAHLFKRVAPAQRRALQDRMGKASKGLFAGILVLAVVLMVIGYKMAPVDPVYDPPVWGRHLNNLMMVIAVALFGLGKSKSRLRGTLRHPMLWGMVTWAVAHLLANGDLASVVLFGSMLVWALVEMPLINAQEPAPPPYQGSVKGDIRLAVITVVVFIVIVLIHGWVGPWPVGG